jgi:hypothetical protein
MRSVSFLLALAFVVAGPNLAGPSDGGLPGIGTFVYSGSPSIGGGASMVVAAR